MKAGQLRTWVVHHAAFALLGRGLAGVPHEVVGDELPGPLERVEEGERPVGPDQREVGVDLDHGQASPWPWRSRRPPGCAPSPRPQLG